MVYTHGNTQTCGINNTHGIELDSWYSIGTSKSHTYKRAECYPYAGFFPSFLLYTTFKTGVAAACESIPLQ